MILMSNTLLCSSQDDLILKYLNVFIMTLPIIAGILGQIWSRYASESRWKIAYVRGMQIASEIYLYRSKVGKYRDISKEALQRAQKERGKEMKLQDERMEFVKRVQKIFASAMESDVGANGSLTFSGTYEVGQREVNL